VILLSYLGKYKQMYELRKIYSSLVELHVFHLLDNLTEPQFRLDLVMAHIRRDLGSASGILNIRLTDPLLTVDNSNAIFDRVTYGHSVEFLEGDI